MIAWSLLLLLYSLSSIGVCRLEHASLGDETSLQYFDKRLFSISRYRTGTSLQLRLMQGVFSNPNDIDLWYFPARGSIASKLYGSQYWEHEDVLAIRYVFRRVDGFRRFQ